MVRSTLTAAGRQTRSMTRSDSGGISSLKSKSKGRIPGSQPKPDATVRIDKGGAGASASQPSNPFAAKRSIPTANSLIRSRNAQERAMNSKTNLRVVKGSIANEQFVAPRGIPQIGNVIRDGNGIRNGLDCAERAPGNATLSATVGGYVNSKVPGNGNGNNGNGNGADLATAKRIVARSGAMAKQLHVHNQPTIAIANNGNRQGAANSRVAGGASQSNYRSVLEQREAVILNRRLFLEKTARELKNYVFYFYDIQRALRQTLSAKIKKLGASVSTFRSPRVTHTITIADPADVKKALEKMGIYLSGGTIKRPMDPKERAHFSGIHLIQADIIVSGKKCWPVKTLEAILDHLGAPRAPKNLEDAIQAEKIFGVSTNRASEKILKDFVPFKGPWIIAIDEQGQHKPIAIRDYQVDDNSLLESSDIEDFDVRVRRKRRRLSRKTPWPKIYLGGPTGRCPFVAFDSQEYARQDAEDLEYTGEYSSEEEHHHVQSTKKTDKKLCNAMEVDEEVDEDGDNAMEGNASGIRNSLTTVMPSIFLKKRHDKSFKELQKKIAPRQVVQPRKQPRKTSRLQPLRPMGVAERREKMKKSMMVHQKPGYCENCNVKYESFSDHLDGRQHRDYSTNEKNFLDLDALLKQLRRAPCTQGDETINPEAMRAEVTKTVVEWTIIPLETAHLTTKRKAMDKEDWTASLSEDTEGGDHEDQFVFNDNPMFEKTKTKTVKTASTHQIQLLQRTTTENPKPPAATVLQKREYPPSSVINTPYVKRLLQLHDVQMTVSLLREASATHAELSETSKDKKRSEKYLQQALSATVYERRVKEGLFSGLDTPYRAAPAGRYESPLHDDILQRMDEDLDAVQKFIAATSNRLDADDVIMVQGPEVVELVDDVDEPMIDVTHDELELPDETNEGSEASEGDPGFSEDKEEAASLGSSTKENGLKSHNFIAVDPAQASSKNPFILEAGRDMAADRQLDLTPKPVPTNGRQALLDCSSVVKESTNARGANPYLIKAKDAFRSPFVDTSSVQKMRRLNRIIDSTPGNGTTGTTETQETDGPIKPTSASVSLSESLVIEMQQSKCPAAVTRIAPGLEVEEEVEEDEELKEEDEDEPEFDVLSGETDPVNGSLFPNRQVGTGHDQPTPKQQLTSIQNTPVISDIHAFRQNGSPLAKGFFAADKLVAHRPNDLEAMTTGEDIKDDVTPRPSSSTTRTNGNVIPEEEKTPLLDSRIICSSSRKRKPEAVGFNRNKRRELLPSSIQAGRFSRNDLKTNMLVMVSARATILPIRIMRLEAGSFLACWESLENLSFTELSYSAIMFTMDEHDRISNKSNKHVVKGIRMWLEEQADSTLSDARYAQRLQLVEEMASDSDDTQRATKRRGRVTRRQTIS